MTSTQILDRRQTNAGLIADIQQARIQVERAYERLAVLIRKQAESSKEGK